MSSVQIFFAVFSSPNNFIVCLDSAVSAIGIPVWVNTGLTASVFVDSPPSGVLSNIPNGDYAYIRTGALEPCPADTDTTNPCGPETIIDVLNPAGQLEGVSSLRRSPLCRVCLSLATCFRT